MRNCASQRQKVAWTKRLMAMKNSDIPFRAQECFSIFTF